MISVIIPFHNEEKNLPILISQLIAQLRLVNKRWEVILVDDGSTDQSVLNVKTQISKEKIENLKGKIKIVQLPKRQGKGKALDDGIKNSQGEVIAFIDGDLQDDPKDLIRFLKKIDQGYDFVNGVRVKREDNIFVKTYSKAAALFLKLFLNSPYRDINCGFKVFRRKVLSGFVFYGNNFRFFPLSVYYQGFKVTEIPVVNHPRKYGRSKFGSGKLIAGLFDILTAYFLYRFSEKPLHFFGVIGFSLFLIGFLISAYLTIERLFFNVLLYRRPILFLGVLLIIVGVQIIMTGVVGELVVYLNKKKVD